MILHPVLIRIPHGAGLSGRERVERQRRFARLALRHCAQLSGAPLDGWTQNAGGVPEPRDGLHWSISHKPLWAAAVIADSPVGIDIERLAPRRSDLFSSVASSEEWSLLGLVTSAAASQSVPRPRGSAEPHPLPRSGEPPPLPRGDTGGSSPLSPRLWHAFFRVWTAKEATLKANGVGISGLKQCRIESGNRGGRLETSFAGKRWAVEHFEYASHLAALTMSGRPILWQVIDAGP